MARLADHFEDRLDRLGSGEQRALFDSKVRSLITDSVATLVPRKPESDEQVARLLSLMEDLAKRMDLLDRKNRNIAEEMRVRDRRERRRRLSIGLVAAALVLLGVGGWVKSRIDASAVSAIAMD
jgi:uncharacterized membrane protein YgaE (UPF0421/DUF939 family)